MAASPAAWCADASNVNGVLHSFRWEASDWLVLRGSVGTTFRGPLASQVSQSQGTALQPIDAAGGGFLSVDVLGNPNLTPESAFTYNIGAVVQVGGFTGSLDYWSYEFKDQIVVEDSNAIANTVVPTPNGLADCSNPLASQIVFQGGWYHPLHPDGHQTFNWDCGGAGSAWSPYTLAGCAGAAQHVVMHMPLNVQMIFSDIGDEVYHGGVRRPGFGSPSASRRGPPPFSR